VLPRLSIRRLIGAQKAYAVVERARVAFPAGPREVCVSTCGVALRRFREGDRAGSGRLCNPLDRLNDLFGPTEFGSRVDIGRPAGWERGVVVVGPVARILEIESGRMDERAGVVTRDSLERPAKTRLNQDCSAAWADSHPTRETATSEDSRSAKSPLRSARADAVATRSDAAARALLHDCPMWTQEGMPIPQVS